MAEGPYLRPSTIRDKKLPLIANGQRRSLSSPRFTRGPHNRPASPRILSLLLRVASDAISLAIRGISDDAPTAATDLDAFAWRSKLLIGLLSTRKRIIPPVEWGAGPRT